MKITTKTGDGGMTSLYDGTRVAKDDLRIELNGEIDELNAALGLCKTLDADERRNIDKRLLTDERPNADEQLPFESIQQCLITLMGIIASPSKKPKADDLQQLRQMTATMETFITAVASKGKEFSFVLPGKNILDAAIHTARTKCRTCERRLITLTHTQALPQELQIFLNRLSDYLFALSLSKE